LIGATEPPPPNWVCLICVLHITGHTYTRRVSREQPETLRSHTINLLWKSDRSMSWTNISLSRHNGRDTHIDKVIRSFVLRPSGLVLEDDIIVPPALHAKVVRVEEGIAPGNVQFALLFRLRGAFFLLQTLAGP
jgi:hypothetical protein